VPDPNGAADRLPAGTGLGLAPGARRLRPGLLCGGRPWRLLRLTAAGDAWIDRWAVGQPVPGSPAAGRLARRLVESGLASVRADPDPQRSVLVVVPARDRAGLAATLDALDPGVDAVVVDDASTDPAATADVVARRPRTSLLRRARRGGPAGARNTGWRSTVTDVPDAADLIAFVDTDCVPPADWTASLAGHFSDPTVGAVAPRISARPAPGAPRWIHAYEAARSPLDLGPDPAPVKPRSSVPYVPTAALVVRRAALVEVDGFDEDLETGEDVDLVWRLDRAGWRVRYDPAVVVGHPTRSDLTGWLRQRVGYGRSAAPLAVRHGAAVAPLTGSRWSVASWVLLGLGHPVAGVALALGSAGRAARTPSAAPLPRAAIAGVALRSHLSAGIGLADAVRRAWWPPALCLALAWRRPRPALLAVAVVPPLVEWRRRRPDLGPFTWTILRLADDLAYGAGVWAGVVRTGRARALLPDLA
jgi:mycofactocin system glycosyltransferase